MTKELTDDSFRQDITEAKGVQLVDFWAPWCGPCRQLAPVIDEVAKEFSGKVDVYKCNIDDNPETPSQYAVRGIPTLMLFKDGQIVDTKVGAVTKSALSAWINENI